MLLIIKTIAIGLKETYDFSNDIIINYILLEKTGIKGLCKKTQYWV